MATLTNTQISVTYVGLLKTSANTVLTSTAQQITDGSGNNSIMFLSTAGVGIGGSPASGKELDVTGNVQITGDLIVDNITIDGSTITNASGDLTIVNTSNDGSVIFQSDDASGGVETYFFLDGGNTSSNPITIFPDNSRLAFGGSQDLEIYHDSSNSHIENATGTLNIEANNLRLGSYGTDNYIIATNAGSVELYHNDVKKFESTSAGVEISGSLTIDGDGNSNAEITSSTASSIVTLNVGGFTGTPSLARDVKVFVNSASGSRTEALHIDSSQNATFAGNVVIDGFSGDKYLSLRDASCCENPSSSGGIGLKALDHSGSANDGLGIYGHDGITLFTAQTLALNLDNSQNATFAGNVSLADSGRARFGAGGDFAIYHNGTDTFLDNSTGDLKIRNFADDKDIIFQSDDGSGGTTEYFRLDGSVVDGGNTLGALSFPDSSKIFMGTGLDLRIYHDGSISYLQNATGDMIIQNFADDADIIFKSDDGSGGTAEYFKLDGSDAVLRIHKRTIIDDSVKLDFGNGQDLQIYHDGSNSYIQDIGTGNLLITSDGASVQINKGTTENMAEFITDGAVKLYYDSARKFETTSTGVTVTGDITFGDSHFIGDDSFDNLQILASSGENVVIQAPTGNQIDLKTAGGSTLILDSSQDATFAGTLKSNTDFVVQVDADNNTSGSVFKILGGGGSELFRVNEAGQVGIGTTSPSEKLHIAGGGSGNVRLESGGTYYGTNVQAISSSGLKLGNDDFSGFMFFADDANVGIGTTSPAYKIDISGSLRATGESTFTSNLLFPDSSRIKLGTGQDFELFHSGTESFISNTTGDLTIQNSADDKDIIFKSDDGSGGVETYFFLDGSNGRNRFAKTVFIPDNIEILIGNGDDLNIKHDGTDSIINNNVGDLILKNSADDKDIIFQSDDGSGGTTAYFRLDGSEAMMKSHKNIRFLDSVKGTFGNNDDLEIYHNGNDSVIDNFTGDLYISNKADDKDIIFRSDDGSGGFTEYFRLDGSLGYNAASKHIQMIDGQAFYAGSGNDLGIFHNGTQSKIENLTGNLTIEQFADDSDIIFKCDDGSGGTAVYFQLDGSLADGTSKFTRFLDNSRLCLGDSADLQIYHDSNNSYIEQTGTGDLIIRNSTDDKDILLQTDNGSGNVTSYIQLDGSDVSTKILTQKVIMSNLPTSDPNNAGQLYNESGFLRVSAG